MFEIQTKYTFEEFKRYIYDTDIARRKFAPDIYKQRFSILRTLAETYMLGSVAFLIWGAFRFEDLWFAAMSGFFGSIVMITLIIRIVGRHSTKKKMNRTTEYELRRVWASDSLTRDSIVTYVFGDDGFDVKLPYGISHIGYGNICFLTETPTNFYIMTSLSKGYLINKKNTDKDARLFIRTHCGVNGSVGVDI